MRRIIAVAVLLCPLVSFGSEWKRERVPYHADATEAYKLELPGDIACHVGRITRNDAVIVIVLRKQVAKGIERIAHAYALYHLEEAVIEAKEGKIREFNLGKVYRPPDKDGMPDLRDGIPDPRLPCLSHAASIPAPHVRGVMQKFKNRVATTKDWNKLYVDGQP